MKTLKLATALVAVMFASGAYATPNNLVLCFGSNCATQSDVDNLEAADDNLQDQIDDLEYEIDQVNREDMRVKRGEVDGDTLTLEVEDMAKSRGRNEIFKREVDIDVSDLNQSDEVADLDSRVTVNEGDIDNLEQRVTTVEGDIVTIEGDITDIEGDVRKVNRKAKRANRRSKNNAVDIDVNQTNISDNSTSISDNSTSISNNSTNIAQNSSAIVNVSNRVTVNEGDISELQKRTNTHETRITNVEGDVTNLREEVIEGDTVLQEQITKHHTEMRSTFEQHAGRITNNTERVSIAEEVIARNTDKIEVNGAAIANNQTAIERNTNAILANSDRIDTVEASVVQLEDEMLSAVAGTLAAVGIPQAQPGRIGVGVGLGHYGGENGLAVGLSGTTEDGIHTFKFSLTQDGHQNGVSAGYMFNF